MPDWLERVKGWIGQLVGIVLALIPLALVLQILFGQTPFLGGNVIGNMMSLIDALGKNGLIGLISLAIVIYLFSALNRR